MSIIARADPYTVVVIPEIRGPVSYVSDTGFNVSAPQLSKVDYAEVIPRKVSGFTPGTSGAKFYVTSGSGNIVTLEMWPGYPETRHLSGQPLSHVAFGLKVYGH